MEKFGHDPALRGGGQRTIHKSSGVDRRGQRAGDKTSSFTGERKSACKTISFRPPEAYLLLRFSWYTGSRVLISRVGCFPFGLDLGEDLINSHTENEKSV